MYRLFQSARSLLPFIALVLLVAAIGARPAFAAGVVGTGTPASCTETLLDAALIGGGAVTFNCGANPATIKIFAIKNISANTSIDGGGKITLQASNTSHFQVQGGWTLTIKNITLTNGKSGSAGAIENFGTLKATNVTFKGNKAVGGGGGAIHNYNIVKVTNSRFENNKASGSGGAISDDGTKVTVKGSQFIGNHGSTGGAISAGSSTLVVKTSSFTGGNQSSDGGAIYLDIGGTGKISNTTIDGNQSKSNGGGISNYGTMTITASTIKNNSAANVGGGISQAGTLTFQTSTLSGNKGVAGGGMYDFGNSTAILRSTISGNQAQTDGGGVYTIINTAITNSTLSGNTVGSSNGGGGWFQHGGTSTFIHVTVANNVAVFGAGIYADGSKTSQINVQQTALSNNTGGNCDGVDIISLGHNLSSDKLCKGYFTGTGDKNNKNAKLGPLANNGGPTLTHSPLTGSPLINTGGTAGAPTDQRGIARPQGPQADIGAVEVQ